MKEHFQKKWKWYLTVIFVIALVIMNLNMGSVMFAGNQSGENQSGDSDKEKTDLIRMIEGGAAYEDKIAVPVVKGETAYGDEQAFPIVEGETVYEDLEYKLEYKCGELVPTGVNVKVAEEDTDILPSEKGTYKLQPDTVYAYTVWGTGITEKSGVFNTSSAIDNKITIEIELVPPKLELSTKNLIGEAADFGKEVSVKILNKTELYDGVTWTWKCVKDNDYLQITPNEKGDGAEVELTGAAGDYHITCEYGDCRSNELTITVPKAELIIQNPDKLPKAEKDYDGLRTITFKTTVDEDSAMAIQGENGKLIYTGDTLKITGELDDTDTGKYKEITIKEVESINSNANITYDISGLLENPRIRFADFMYKINQAKIKISGSQNIYLYYRKNVMDWDRTEKNIKLPSEYDGESGECIRRIFLEALGQVIITDIDNKKCTFHNLMKEECQLDGTEYSVDSDNIKFLFDSNKFTYEWSSEMMGVLDISQIAMMQGQHNLFSEAEKSDEIKCDETEIYMDLSDTGAGDSYYNAYDKVTYRKTDGRIKDFREYDIYNDYEKTGAEEQLKVELDSDGEACYEMFFVKENVSSAVAAILHFIGEDVWDENTQKTEQITDGQGHTYTIINILFDDTADIVEFESGVGGMVFDKSAVSSICVGKKWKGEKEMLFFEIKNKGFAVGGVWYMSYKIDSTGDKISDIEVSPEISGTTGKPVDKNWKSLTVNDKNQYSAALPTKEGDYVILVMVSNVRGKTAAYVSNGIIIDRTAPIADVTFKEAGRTLKNVSTNKEKPAYRANAITANFKITEPHLKDVEVTVTAKDGKENKIEQALNEEEIEKLKTTLLNKKEGTFTFTADANYTIKIIATDVSELKNDGKVYYFTIDTTAPETGMVQAEGIFQNIKNNTNKKQGKIDMVAGHFQETWNQLLTDIEYNIFSQEEIVVTLEGNDRISPVTIYYYIAEGQMTIGQLEEIESSEWKEYSANTEVRTDINKKIIIYEKVVDRAGNSSYFCSNGMITDSIGPEIQVSYEDEQNKNGFYNDNITFTAFVKDGAGPGEYGCSGLQLVSYRIERGEKVTKSKILYEAGQDEITEEKEFTETIEADSNNSNDITLYITSVDHAGNRCDYKKEIRIDNVSPEITVTYDNNNSIGKYYSRPRTATIAIKERNLDTGDVKLSVNSISDSAVTIGKWRHSENVGQSNDAVYECNVTFSKDDEYVFEVSCTDKAGNQSQKNYRETFIIDTTAPLIEVSYNGQVPERDSYFNESVIATITIMEHNFDERKVKIQTGGFSDTYETVEPVISGFKNNGDVHRATVLCHADGKYALEVSYTDEAGNAAGNYRGNPFVLDMTKPEVTITNIEDKSANKGEVRPVITCTDMNYDENRVSISVTGSNGGKVNLETIGYSVSNVEKGQQFVMDFPKAEQLDNLYTLTVSVQDRAGNEEESSIEFSVNRYGSVYTLGEETEEWLKRGEHAYIQEGKPIVILETNVDKIVSQNISYNIGSIDSSYIDIKEVEDCSKEEKEKGLYYKVSSSDSGHSWCQRRYEINPENFKEEGNYTIQINSTDIAGNCTSNISNRHSDGKLSILFTVDRTVPSVALSGAENGGIYNETEHTILLDVQDNLALDNVTVYVNDGEYGNYTAEEIAAFENGLIPVRIGQSLSMQRIRVIAKDMAGNVLGDTESGYDRKFEQINILVTTNPFVRFFHTTWALIASMLFIATAAGIVIIIHRRRCFDNEIPLHL